MGINTAHVKWWMSEHETLEVGPEVSAGFASYLQKFPWKPYRMDWGQVRHVELSIRDDWEAKVAAIAQRSPFGRFSHVMLMFSGTEPALVGRRDEILRDVDLLCAVAPGPRYFCGASIRDGHLRAHFGAFGEFDGFSKVLFRT
jgi:hypothetical protein